MIFSTDRCPICNAKLELEIRELTTKQGGKVAFIYKCKKTEVVRNDSNTSNIARTHYQNDSYQGGQLCQMIIPPYILFHSESNEMTGVYKMGGFYEDKKLLFRTGLLDLDWAQPHLVIDKLKLLVIFS
jgi:hypothetical protein